MFQDICMSHKVMLLISTSQAKVKAILLQTNTSLEQKGGSGKDNGSWHSAVGGSKRQQYAYHLPQLRILVHAFSSDKETAFSTFTHLHTSRKKTAASLPRPAVESNIFIQDIDEINNNWINAKYCQMAFQSVLVHLPLFLEE